MSTPRTRTGLRLALAGLRLWWLVTAVVGVGFVASGCTSNSISARPRAFGPPGTCYYVTSPKECRNQGASGIPAPMPPVWLATYWPYYSSPAYATRVPSEDEDEYANDLKTFSSQNQDLIDEDASDGEWTDQDGNTWEGDPSSDPAETDDSSDGGGDSGDSGADDGGGDDGGGDDGGGGDD